jgi:hypothetical protein
MTRNTTIISVCILIIIPLNCIYADNTTHTHHAPHAPKRLRVIPNLVQEEAWTINLESNVYQGTVYLSPQIEYSAKNGWDFSVASYNIPVQGSGAQNFEYDTYFGISKTFQFNKDVQFLIGTQNGSTILAKPHEWHQFHFANIRYDVFSPFTVYIGPYYSNQQLTTTVNQVGFMTGFQLKIVPNIFHITGDYVSGHQNVSGAVINLQWFVFPKFQLYTGIIVPETNSNNEFAGIVGFNLLTKDF